MRAAIGINAVLALLLELALLGAGVGIGLLLPGPLGLRIVAAVALPAATIVVWGLWLAPRSLRRLAAPGRVLLETALFAAAVLGLAALGAIGWAVALAALAAARLALGVRLGRV